MPVAQPELERRATNAKVEGLNPSGHAMHETGAKGDIGVARITADLIEKQFNVLLPVDSTSPFDLVAHKNEKFIQVQAKYRESKNGFIEARTRRMSISRSKISIRSSKAEIDVLAIFCPTTQKCYYVHMAQIKGNCLILRIDPTKNNQKAGVRKAKNFTNLT